MPWNNNWNNNTSSEWLYNHNNNQSEYNPPQQNEPGKHVHIQVNTTPYIRPNLIEGCIQGEKDQFTLGNLIFDFEEDELTELKTELEYMRFQGHAVNRLYAMLKEIADELGVHLKLFIGHIEVCEQDYLQPIENTLDTIDEPTIIILVACLGSTLAKQANEKEVWRQSNAVVMAFEDLVHIYMDEIYACKLSHVSLPNMSCTYDDRDKDYNQLVEDFGSPGATELNDYNVSQAKYDQSNPLVDCCRAKLDRFRSIFLENFRKRQCVKFTKEKILEKMRKFMKGDGSFDRDILENPASYTFSSTDGISCADPEGSCKIINPYKHAENVARNFNQKSILFTLFQKFKDVAYAQKPGAEKDKETLTMLQSLKQTEMGIFKYADGDGTLLHVLSMGGCVESLLYILKRKITLPLDSLNESNNSFIEELMSSEFVKEEGCLRVLIKLLELEPEFFTDQSPDRIGVLFNAVARQFLSIVQYLSEHTTLDFSKSIYPDFNNYNLINISYQYIPWTTEQSYKLVKLLLVKGVEPNHIADNNSDIFSDYFGKQPPIVKEKILKELCYYGYSNKYSVDNGIQFFSGLLQKPLSEIRYKEELRKEINDFEEKHPEETDEAYLKSFQEYVDARELTLENFKPVVQNAIRLLEECKTIINRGGKKEAQLAVNKVRTLKQTKQNVQNTTRRLLAPDKITTAYQNVNTYIKSVGAKFSKNEKKTYRNRGISVLQNKNTNALERLQTLENLLKEIMEESGKRTKGGRRTRKLRKD